MESISAIDSWLIGDSGRYQTRRQCQKGSVKSPSDLKNNPRFPQIQCCSMANSTSSHRYKPWLVTHNSRGWRRLFDGGHCSSRHCLLYREAKMTRIKSVVRRNPTIHRIHGCYSYKPFLWIPLRYLDWHSTLEAQLF